MKTPPNHRRLILTTLALLLAGATLLLATHRALTVSAGAPPASPGATLTVVNPNDNGPGSLRQAISDAGSGDTINFDTAGVFASPQMIVLTSGELIVNQDLTINGPGADVLMISGNQASRAFFINPGAPGATTGPPAASLSVNINNLTIANGKAQGGNGGRGNLSGAGGGAAGMGGAIFVNNGALSISNVNFSANVAVGGSGGLLTGGSVTVYGGGGGGVGGNAYGSDYNGDNSGVGAGGTGGNLGGLGGTNGLPGGEGAGGGGARVNHGAGGSGGFGGGAAGGGGAFFSGLSSPGGAGGFGGGGGGGGDFGQASGVGGPFAGKGGQGIGGRVAGGGGGGAGLGGAIFIRAGSLSLTNSSFTSNSATGGSRSGYDISGLDLGTDGQGKGGAIFINDGTSATGSSIVFGGNIAANAVGNGLDTNDVYGRLVQPMRFTVNSLADTDDGSCDALNCTLREAINAANLNLADNTIDFSVTGTITLASALPAISQSVTINGPGANQLTVSGNHAVRVFEIVAGAAVNLNRMTIADGKTADSGGDLQSFFGGGVSNSGTLAVDDAIVSGNSAGIYGGGISNQGSLTVNNSTISGNSTRDSSRGDGGGIFNAGWLMITNDTFTGNSAASNGGGIANYEGVTMQVMNATISGNAAGAHGGGIDNRGSAMVSCTTVVGNVTSVGGGIDNVGTLAINNSIVAGNAASGIGPDMYEVPHGISGDHNLIQDATGWSFNSGGAHNMTGVDPKLGPLQDNGGPTFTQALLPGSPAIDAGSNALAVDGGNNPLTTDQRGPGFPRINGGTVDIGAFEFLFPFAISASPDSQTFTEGGSTSFAVSTTNLGGSPVAVSLSATASTAGLSVSFDPSSVLAGGSSTLTVLSSTPGTYTVTVKGTSSAGSASTTVTVNVVSANHPPVAKAKNITVSAGSDCAATITAAQIDDGSTDPDNNDTITLSLDGSGPFTLGAHQVTLTATDNHGASSTAPATVTVVDTTPPTLTLNGDNPLRLEVCAGLNDPGVTVHDACDPNAQLLSGKSSKILYTAPGTYTITYTAVDASGNRASIDRTVNVVDTTPPQISLHGDSVTTVESCSTFVDPGAVAMDLTCNKQKNNLSAAIVVTGSVNASVPGTYVLHYNVSDESGNAAPEVTRTVNVVDTTPPKPDSATLPDLTGSCSVSLPAAPTAADDCHGRIVGVPDKTGPFAQGDDVITWAFTDAAGNRSTQTQAVHVHDVTAPVPDAASLPDITGQCAANLPAPPTATDGCDGKVIGVANKTGPFAQGDDVITWTFTDRAGNRSTQTQAVHVHDTTAPVITLYGLSSMQVESCAAFVDPGATASDNCAGTLTSAIVVTGSVNTTVPGTYMLHYNVSDPNHNAAAEVTRTVKVVDRIAPVIVMAGANPMTVELGLSFSDPGATASDGCHPAVPVVVSGAVNANALGTYTLTYTAKDNSNNSTQVTRTVRVVDTTAPKVVAPSASSIYSDINCQGAVPNLLLQVVASDLGGAVTLTQNPAAGTLVGTGQQTIKITGKDPSGNTTIVTTTFTVIAGPSFTVSVSPGSVKRGGSVTLSTSFHNCATTNQALTLEVSLVNPSGKTVMVSLPFTMKAGQTGSLSLPAPISKSTPAGNYSLTLDVYVGGVKIGTSTAQLTVTL